jgi:hypothetical protein
MELTTIKDLIEIMPKNYHIEIGRILIKEDNISYDENKNGIFINLSLLDKSIHEKIVKFIEYVELKEKQLAMDEKEKLELKDTFF